jgi:hypothetical protein
VHKLLRDIKMKTSAGLDGVPAVLLKTTAALNCCSLAQLFKKFRGSSPNTQNILKQRIISKS